MSFQVQLQIRASKLIEEAKYQAFYDTLFSILAREFPHEAEHLKDIENNRRGQDASSYFKWTIGNFIQEREGKDMIKIIRSMKARFESIKATDIPYVEGYYTHKEITRIPIYSHQSEEREYILVKTSELKLAQCSFVEKLALAAADQYYNIDEATSHQTYRD